MVDISGLDLTNVFKLVNLAVGILAVLGGISQFFPVSFQSTIIAIYVILFGVGITFLADHTVSTFDVDTGVRVHKHTGHSDGVNSLDTVRRGTELIVSGGDDGAIRIWDPREKAALTSLVTPYPVLAVAVDPVGAMVYSAGVDEHISAWDVRKLYSDNSSGNGSAPAPVYTLAGHTDTITSLRVSPDGQTLLSNAMDSTVRTWNVRPFSNGPRALNVYDGAPAGVEQLLLRAKWNADGTRIAAGSGADFTVVIWDSFTRRILHKLPGHKGSVNDVCFSPVEPVIATGSSDATIILGEY
ncbi:hypothetical protein DV452_004791 [Geotrichum candidum]|nr:hypothetical protein DV452_004791 [Geotrichum candidum]KAI9211808.1 hypothetical protein DS838_003315 [Geotrichum bryndzae]